MKRNEPAGERPALKPLRRNAFTTCDGSPASDDLLAAQLDAAVEREDYELAAEINGEINRRARQATIIDVIVVDQ